MTVPPATFRLTKIERKQIEKRQRLNNDHRIGVRLWALLWLDEGKSEKEVAQLLHRNARTVRNWLRLYTTQGLEALCTLQYQGSKGQLSQAQGQQLREEVKSGRFRSARQVRQWLQDTFGVRYSESGTKKLLQRLGCSFHKASGFLFKAKRDKQEAFVAKYEAQRQEVGPTCRRYFVDGVHPIWGVEILFYCWLLVGQRLEVGVGGGRKRLNILGAYCPEDHEYLDRRYVKENLNAQSLIDLMQLMRQRHPQVKRFVLYLDNARYHHARLVSAWIAKIQQEEGVVFLLEFLPAYSPNLNLIERLWKFLRKKALQQWHPTFEAMQQEVAGVLDHLADYEKELATLMAERFHLVPETASEAA
jgi:transposase